MSSLSPKSAVVGYEHAIAGFAAGATATLLTYPLDLLRTRFQVKDLKQVHESLRYKSVWDAVKSIVRQEGLPGLYQGFMPNFIGSAIAWGQYFYLYQRFKEVMRGSRTSRQELGPGQHLAAGFSAGAVTATCTNPIWVVKTRMQTQMRGTQGNYRGLLHGIMVLWREEGIQGFYRGWVPAMLGVSHGAVQFMAYEEIRKLLSRHLARNEEGKVQMNTFHFMGMACLSKLAASVITYPALVLRSRLQIRPPQFTGFVDCCTWTWRQQGILGTEIFSWQGPSTYSLLTIDFFPFGA